MKKSFILMLALAAGAVWMPMAAFADHGKQCAMHDQDCNDKDCQKCDGDYKCPIVAKIMKKSKFFLENQKEIGLTDEQTAQIKAIKFETKKNYVLKSAEMEVFQMALDEKLSQPKLDTEALNAMIDQASAGWGTASKEGIATYAKLKAILNDQQMAKAKEIWMKDKN